MNDRRQSDAPDPHALIVGAGPAGLGAAIGLAQNGVITTVIDRQERPGEERRGETIRYDDGMAHIVGRDFFDRIALAKISRRRYCSHSGLRHVDRTITSPNIIFSWPELVSTLVETARREGVKFHAGTRAVGLESAGGTVTGVSALRGTTRVSFQADTVLVCAGCNGPVTMGLTQDRAGIDMPVHKRLVTGYRGPDNRLEYHLHVDRGGLVVGTMFPRGNGEAEFILLDTSGTCRQGLSFDMFCAEHPLFSGLMEGSRAFYELVTRIPMGGMLYPFSPAPGLVMAGDALGHVQARGGSGIRTSFLIGHAAGSLAADVMRSGGWTERNRNSFEKAMRGHPQVRSLRLHNLMYAGLRSKLFALVRTASDMDRAWPLLSLALR